MLNCQHFCFSAVPVFLMSPGLQRLSHRAYALSLTSSLLLSAVARAQAPAAVPNPPATAPAVAAPAVAAPVAAAANAPAANASAAAAPASGPLPIAPPALPARGTYKITGNAQALSVFAVGVDAQELFTAIA